MTTLKTFTLCAGFYDCDSRATLTVKAATIEAACRIAVERIDNGQEPTERTSWDPGRTFVMGIGEGVGDPWAGCDAVPDAFADPTERTAVERAAPDLLAAVRALLPLAESRVEDIEAERGEVLPHVWEASDGDASLARARAAVEAARAAVSAAEAAR